MMRSMSTPPATTNADRDRSTRDADPAPATPVRVDVPGDAPRRPLVGISMDVAAGIPRLRRPYLEAIDAAGGVPVPLPPVPEAAVRLLARCDALVLSGGDDPDVRVFGAAVHPKARLVHEDRQRTELALLGAADARPELPVLGICLGMQYLALAAGGHLDQHLPDTCPTADLHWNRRTHTVEGALGSGEVLSHHRQAIDDPGDLEVVGVAPDGVIEAVRDPRRRHALGVQWHPERTAEPAFGRDLLANLVAAAAEHAQRDATG